MSIDARERKLARMKEWNKNNLERKREWARKDREKNRERYNLLGRIHYQKFRLRLIEEARNRREQDPLHAREITQRSKAINRDKILLAQRTVYKERYKRDRQTILASGKRFRMRNKKDAIFNYSKGENKCACCGEDSLMFLTIDHINGGGRQHLKQINGNLYLWLRRNKYPEGFQVLCYNCNCARDKNGGSCPHTTDGLPKPMDRHQLKLLSNEITQIEQMVFQDLPVTLP